MLQHGFPREPDPDFQDLHLYCSSSSTLGLLFSICFGLTPVNPGNQASHRRSLTPPHWDEEEKEKGKGKLPVCAKQNKEFTHCSPSAGWCSGIARKAGLHNA